MGRFGGSGRDFGLAELCGVGRMGGEGRGGRAAKREGARVLARELIVW